MKRIFISYSHKDEEWKDRLIRHLNVLAMEGNYSVWDDRQIETGDEWFKDIERELNAAHIVIMMISADFLTSNFIRREEVPRIMTRRNKEGVWVIPLVVKPCAWERVDWLSALQASPTDGKPLSTMKEHEIDSELAALTKRIAERINVKVKGKKEHEGTFIPLPPEKISISKLPTTGKDLFGREKELAMLDEAWQDEQTCVVALVAWGGVGKTALVNRWLNMMARENYRGAKRVYAWSFYSQGAEQGKQASADEFMQETLAWFGDPQPDQGTSVEKGRRLARLLGNEKTLLILDGNEPLQYPPGEAHGLDGRFKDPGMRAFLRELCGKSFGLCVMTSREQISDLEDQWGFSAKEMALDRLGPGAGARLLKSLGVAGPGKEIAAAVKEYDGHALALTLLGNFIAVVHDGDIRKRDLVADITEDEEKGGHARRVMASYEKWLDGSPELDILYIMGLFDRPAPMGAIVALKEKPAISGVTDRLQGLSDKKWRYALKRLRSLGLLAREETRQKEANTLDCHPLIREHFGERLQEHQPEAWKEAHQRLYHYFKDLPRKELPDTLAEMEPLFAAVAHGCQAGLHEEARYDVYWQRISRGNEHYIKHKLGAFGADLAVLSHFFEVPWSQPAAGLPDEKKALVLSWAAFALRALGLLHEAVQPFKASLEAAIQQKDWRGAAKDASNLSELLLCLGKVEDAVEAARRSVDYADKSGDEFQKCTKRITLADPLHQAGDLKEAEKWFKEAEAMQKERQPEYPFLYSLQGFQFCDLLISRSKYGEVLERAQKFFEWRVPSDSLLTVSLDNLIAGRAHLVHALEENTGDVSQAADHLDRAVAGLRESGTQDHLPRGLLARAEFYRIAEEYNKAWEDLEEAREIAELGGMRLYLADYLLEAGKLCAAEGKEEQAVEHFKEAKGMMERMGYKKRLQEVEEALGATHPALRAPLPGGDF